MKTSITDRIFEYLKQNDIKDAQLSRTLSVTRTTISEWRNGKNEPSARLILKFLFHFNDIDANWLLHGQINPKSNTQVATGNKNIIAGGAASVNSSNHLQIENNHLKQIITEKEKQISLLEKLVK